MPTKMRFNRCVILHSFATSPIERFSILVHAVCATRLFLFNNINAVTQIATDTSDPAGAASPIGYSVSVKYFDARYEPGTRTNVIEIILCRNPI